MHIDSQQRGLQMSIDLGVLVVLQELCLRRLGSLEVVNSVTDLIRLGWGLG